MAKNEANKKLYKDEIFNLLLGAEEVLDREITSFGTGAHVIVPQKHLGKKVKVLIKKKD